jgi:hypothetical protein
MSRILEVDIQWQTTYYYSVCPTQCIQLIPGKTLELFIIIIMFLFFIYFFFSASGFLPSGSGTTVRHNTHHTK